LLTERVQRNWVEAFIEVFSLCGVEAGETAAVLSESQSRSVNVQLSELALAELGAQPVHIVVPTPPASAPVPVRSTGASSAIAGSEVVIAALSACTIIADCTVEGLLHASELPAILKSGARVLMVSDEHPETLERLIPRVDIQPKVAAGVKLMKDASEMRVTSDAGTDLTVDMQRAFAAGGCGWTTRTGDISHWPGGLCAAFPRAGCVNGTIVMDKGDMNLTFKRYVETPITLTIENDYVVDIAGDGLDAELFESYMAAWDDRDAYATSHVGWGMNPQARWDAFNLYDKSQTNGTEQRVFAGNFLYSTGANPSAGRHTLGHFDLPMRNCTIALDGHLAVERGVLQGDLA